MFLDYVVSDLLVGGHRAYAVFHGLHPERFKGQLDLQIKVPLASRVACPAQGAGIDDLKGLFIPAKHALCHGMADPHLSICPVCVKLVHGRARASCHEPRARHIGMIHPCATLALDATAHVIYKILDIVYIQSYIRLWFVVSYF